MADEGFQSPLPGNPLPPPPPTPQEAAAQIAAQAAAQEAAARVAAQAAAQMAAQAAVAAVEANTISGADFARFLQSYRAPPKLVTLAQPRVGGVNTTGAWTGPGSGRLGLDPQSGYCMRQFQADPIKNHQAMNPIEEKCRRGLSSSTDPLFSLAGEPDADKIIYAIRAFEKHVVYTGMDAVFDIVPRNGGTVVRMLQEPGLIDTKMIEEWIEDLLAYGVNGKRPCTYDKTNLAWSGEAILNSCTDALRLDLETTVPLADQNGPTLLCKILLMLYRPSHSKVRELRAQLEALSLRSIPGENVTILVQQANAIIRELKMNFMQPDQVPDLIAVALTGFVTGSDSFFRDKVRHIRLISDRNDRISHSPTGTPKKLADITEILAELEETYRSMVQQNDYAPAASAVLPKGVHALVGEVKDMKEQLAKLQQDRNSKSSGGSKSGSGGACHICGSKDHWANSCPQKGTAGGSSGGSSSSPTQPRHGLDPETNLKITALIKAKEATMPTRLAIAAMYEVDSKATAQFDITLDGSVVAKYCLHCGRFTKGKTAHSSADHTGKKFTPRPGGAAAPSPAPAPPPAAAGCSALTFPMAPPAPVPSDAVAMAASTPVAPATAGGFDLSDVPIVDTASFLCQAADYETPPSAMLSSIVAETGGLFDFIHLNE